MQTRKRLLFFAEAVTLAHLARPLALAGHLDPDLYDVTVACPQRHVRFLLGAVCRHLPLESITSARFTDALARGSPVYDVDTLRRYLREDLRLIDEVRPDLVIGDFRLSLSASCRLAKVPYASITNAYWSPAYRGQRYPLPVLPMTRLLPLPVARAIFAAAGPLAFPVHCRPLNRLRTENGLASLGNDLRRIYTDADHVLYADAPDLFEMDRLADNHRFLGPVLWSPPVAPPVWWDALASEQPTVYVTLGSSGDPSTLHTVLNALTHRPLTVIASTAGAPLPGGTPANVFVADYLPGEEAAARSRLVICNGGSPTSQQALAAGVPVLGIAGNMDQFLNMQAVERHGAGLLMRADRLTPTRIAASVDRLLDAPQFAAQAKRIATANVRQVAGERFTSWLNELFEAIASR